MLYHSPIKHFLKGLLNRKNNAWYFDRLIGAYEDGKLSQHLLDIAEQLVKDQALVMAKYNSNILSNPLYAILGAIANSFIGKVQKCTLDSRKKNYYSATARFLF